MINRREVLASGIAATLLGGASAAAVRSGARVEARAGPSVFVADQRIPASRAAANAAETLGSIVQPLTADVTPVYEWLDLKLRDTSAPVAGLTTPHALFPIERLAWDRGLRTIYRGIHGRVDDGHRTHELAGSPEIIGALETVGDRHWFEVLGRVLAAAASQRLDDRHLVTEQWLPPSDDRRIVSWLLVPRATLRRKIGL